MYMIKLHSCVLLKYHINIINPVWIPYFDVCLNSVAIVTQSQLLVANILEFALRQRRLYGVQSSCSSSPHLVSEFSEQGSELELQFRASPLFTKFVHVNSFLLVFRKQSK